MKTRTLTGTGWPRFFRRTAAGPATLGVALVGVLLLAGCAASSRPVQTSSVPAGPPAETAPLAQVLGQWEGITYSYPHPLGMKITLREGRGTTNIEGEVHFYPLRQTRDIINPPPNGRFAVSGRYDPAHRTLQLTPSREWIDRPTRVHGTGRPPALAGVFEEHQPALAGWMGGERTWFVVTRPDQAARTLTDPMMGRAVRGGGQFRRDEQTIVRWAGRLGEEHPDVDLQRIDSRRLYPMAANLFADEHFRAHFGRTFDQLSSGQFASLNNTLAPRRVLNHHMPGSLAHRMHRSPPEPSEEVKRLRPLASAFDTYPTTGRTIEVMHIVLAQRVIRTWQQTQIARLQHLTEPPEFERIAPLVAGSEPYMRTLWPSEQAAYTQSANEVRRRLAGPWLHMRADRIVSAAEGRSGARALAAWHGQQSHIIPWAPREDGVAAAAKVNARLDELLPGLMAGELAKLDRFDGGIRGLEQGIAWFRNFESEFGFARQRPAYRQARAQFFQRRTQHLNAAFPLLVDQIMSMDRSQEIDRLVDRLLVLPGDRETEGGQIILLAAHTRKEEMRLADRRQWQMIVGGLLASYLEMERRLQQHDENPLLEGMAKFGRDRMIEMTYRAMEPEATTQEVQEVRRVIALALDGELFSRENRRLAEDRDRLVAELKQRYPDLSWEPQMVNLLLDLHKTFSR